MLFFRHNSALFAGPKQVRLPDSRDEGFNRFEDFPISSGIDSGSNITPISAPIIVTPEIAAQEIAGGATPGQIDIAARQETQEGAPVIIAYGKLLFGATNVVSHKYVVSPSKQNRFSIVLGEGWGGLGKHGEWHRIVKAWYLGEELINRYSITEWIRDRLPLGAVLSADEDGWNFVSVNPPPYLGKFSHQAPNKSGFHHHSFSGAAGLPIDTGDVLTTWVYLDPTNPPTAIMAEFFVGGDPNHRAYWGPNVFVNGTNGTPSRWQVNASVPPTGSWQRIDVLASAVAVEGSTITGMGFCAHDGLVTWGPVVRWKTTTGGNTGYIFRPGIIAPDVNDLIQAQNLSTVGWEAGTISNGAAAVTVRLSTAQSEQDRPDGFKCVAECRCVSDFDATGAEILENYGYSTNPARVAADRIRAMFETRYRNNPELAARKFRERVHWPSWCAWRDYCDGLIPWDRLGDGVSVFIKRFEANIGFADDLSLAAVLDQLTGLSASFWQDTGRQLVFLLPVGRQPVHHLHYGNIATGSVRHSVIDLRKLPNDFIARFRDSEDDALGVVSIRPPDNTFEHALRLDSIAKAGRVIRSEREFSNMTQSQGARLLTYRAQLELHNPERLTLVGLRSAIKLLKGDLVTVSHPTPGWEYQLCLVLGATLRSSESSPSAVALTLQKLNGPLYSDLAHRARQEALTLS